MTVEDSKKILILYATAGSGHKKAAEAIFHKAKSAYRNVHTADVVKYMPFLVRKLYSDGYTFVISHLPWLWAVMYRLSDSPRLSWINVGLRRFMDVMACRSFVRFLLDEDPDIIISTQFLASEIAAYAKIKKRLKARIITVVTDYGVHNFWVNPGTDLYCAAAPSTKDILMKKGISESQIVVTGIPLDEKFLHVDEAAAVRKKLEVKEGVFTVLVATGGIGIGPIAEIADRLKNDAQLLVVCGHNKKLHQALTDMRHPHIKAFGFVDNMQELMRVSDVMVTKAGGLSVTEALNMELPMILFCLLPGQETINANTMQALGAGRIVSGLEAIEKEVLDFKKNEQKLYAFRANCRALARPASTVDIVNLIEAQL
ncbi:monogalactosyldiacylglycerol synthase [Candidatus Velamenicoccus archaeovorus]|uniref:Monogalactosyldiacylglycerol synthase n=1 Tax=Velamenicoccus archaeovorus TaxID=1930593 RepID=A0A410P4F1_VELA1|nr:glycosyltransferase [Candidatus Velamenicoccus archaeovorus]QAT17002.1 monogalactosyldiacylglycerol synthase [Candidatus Velamenicoccus archaeovorus]